MDRLADPREVRNENDRFETPPETLAYGNSRLHALHPPR